MAKCGRPVTAGEPRAAEPAGTAGPEEAFTLVELFAGGGLVRLGFGEGWRVVLANDSCEKKARTYRRNFGNGELMVGDVADLQLRDIPSSDALWASFPCKDHSSAGLRKGFNGVRGSTVFPVIKRLQASRCLGRAPAVVAFENVRGFLSQDDGGDFRLLVERMARCGYRMGGLVLDAADWLPQERVRVFLVGVRSDLPPTRGLSAPVADPAWHPPCLRKAVKRLDPKRAADWVWWTLPKPEAHGLTVADILEDVGPEAWSGPEATDRLLARLGDTGRRRLDAMREAGGTRYGVIDEGTCTRLKRRVTSVRAEKAFTVMATTTGTNRQRLVKVDGAEVRTRDFTVREFARLMGAPETYIVPEKRVPAVEVLGDAVAVPAVRHLVRHLIEPLVRAARVAPKVAPEDGRRPLKDRTVGTTVYLPMEDQERAKRFAAARGIPLYGLMVTAVSTLMAAAGEEPLKAVTRWRKDPPGHGAGIATDVDGVAEAT